MELLLAGDSAAETMNTLGAGDILQIHGNMGDVESVRLCRYLGGYY